MRALLWLGWAAALANSFVAPTPRRASLRKHSRDRARAFAAPDDDIDALEVRLDVTILWCHCLARELCRELTHNPPKAVPGFTVADLSALAVLRTGLRGRLAASPLCDGPRFTRQLEAAFRTMWREWCAAGG